MGRALAIDVPFDPKEAFGRVRAPVRVTINGFEFRTTIAPMSGRMLIGINKEVRAGTGVSAGERVTVDVVLDDEPRTVEIPADLAAAIDAGARAFLDSLAFTDRKEYVLERVSEARRDAAGTDRKGGRDAARPHPPPVAPAAGIAPDAGRRALRTVERAAILPGRPR